MATLSTNGKWTVTNITYTVLLLLVTAWFGWLTQESLEARDFRSAGERFTNEDAHPINLALQQLAMDVGYIRLELTEFRTEDRRLQLQIDRLEGHDTSGGYDGGDER